MDADAVAVAFIFFFLHVLSSVHQLGSADAAASARSGHSSWELFPLLFFLRDYKLFTISRLLATLDTHAHTIEHLATLPLLHLLNE